MIWEIKLNLILFKVFRYMQLIFMYAPAPYRNDITLLILSIKKIW